MTQPTQGEWRVLGNTAIYAGDKMIAMTAVKDVPDLDERRANIELMAAAPDLLAALDFCKSVIEAQGMFDRSEQLAFRKAVMAIAKARKTELRNQQ